MRIVKNDNLIYGAGLIFAAGIAALALLPLGSEAQIQLVMGAIGLMLLLRRAARNWSPLGIMGQTARILICLLAVFISVRYLAWRTLYTLPTQDPLSFAAGLLLYLAEVYAFVIMSVGAFVTISPLHRPVAPLPDDPAEWPSVDVLIPSYNESEELLEVTLLGALNLDYPREKLKIYLLDDGGTVAKRHQPDLAQATAAHRRHRRLRALCERLGVHYLTREKNESAKAGNINSALPHIHGDLVLILDADHVPTVDFLRSTAGWFNRDPQLFLVQTPHFFVSPDPIEKNLKTYQHMPSEQEMFYTNVQRGLDFWNSSFFCGSAAILRRRCLDEVGGIQGVSITEDAETALALHARGYRSAYIWKPMVAGLQPESFVSFVKQRVRWAQGMTQLLMLKNPLRNPGLSWHQRLGYLNSMLFWLFPFARMIFLLAPLAYLLFGLGIYNANLYDVVLYTLPHLAGGIIITDYLYGNARWAFVSEFYELVLSLFMIKPLIQVMRSPRSPNFEVTAKGELSNEDHISPLVRPLYPMLALTLFGILVGIWRYIAFPWQQDIIAITLAWEVINLCMLLGALGALLERQQHRAMPRIPFKQKATLYAGEKAIDCQTSDLSVGGVGVLINAQEADWMVNQRSGHLVIRDPNSQVSMVDVRLQSSQRMDDDNVRMGFRFVADSIADKAEIVRLVYGDSERWRTVLRERNHRIGILKSAAFVSRLMFGYILEHFQVLLSKPSSHSRAELQPALATVPITASQTLALLAVGASGEPISRREFDVAHYRKNAEQKLENRSKLHEIPLTGNVADRLANPGHAGAGSKLGGSHHAGTTARPVHRRSE